MKKILFFLCCFGMMSAQAQQVESVPAVTEEKTDTCFSSFLIRELMISALEGEYDVIVDEGNADTIIALLGDEYLRVNIWNGETTFVCNMNAPEDIWTEKLWPSQYATVSKN